MTSLDNHFKVAGFSCYEDFKSHVQNTIDRTETCEHFVYEGVGWCWGTDIVHYVNKTFEEKVVRKNYNSYTRRFWVTVNPDELLNCSAKWFDNCLHRWSQAGFVCPEISEYLMRQVGRRLVFTQKPYTLSCKELDFCVVPQVYITPTLVIVSGWSYNEVEMLNDMSLFFLADDFQRPMVVIIITWTKLDTTRVAGTVGLYVQGPTGEPYMAQELDIFPRPVVTFHPDLIIDRWQLFKHIGLVPRLATGHQFLLYLDELRTVATEALTEMGLVPA